jgi:transposase
MVEPEAVAAMLRLTDLGWGSKRIARELGVSRGTVKRYLAAGGWQPFKTPERKKLLDGHEAWLRERFRRHRDNADVVRQELAAEKHIVASLRTVQRAWRPIARSFSRKPAPRYASRRRRASRSRSTSASGWSKSAAAR